MISGALFLGKDKPIKELFKKNILKLIIVFFVWSLIYAIWETSIGNTTAVGDFFINLFKGPSHLWFILMIIGLYIITPLLKTIIADPKKMKYFLTLSFIFAFLIPEIISTINIVLPPAAETIKYMNTCLNIRFVLGFSGYYLLGYYLHNATISRKTELIIYILGFLGILITALFSALASYYKNVPTAVFYENMSVNVLFTSIAVFVFAKKHLNKKLSLKKQKVLTYLSECILGVYLVHLLILFILDHCFYFNVASFNPIFSVPVLCLSVFVCSFIISALLNKIPFVKKWLV